MNLTRPSKRPFCGLYNVTIQARSAMTKVASSKSVPELLFHSALFIWLFVNVLNLSVLSPHMHIRITALACFGLLVASELVKVRTTRVLLPMLLLAVLSLVVAANTRSLSMFMLIGFIICGRDIRFEQVAHTCLLAVGIPLVMIVLLSQMGMLVDYVLSERSGRVRHYLGFRYALMPARLTMTCTCLYVFIKRDMGPLEYLAILGMNVAFYAATESRLSFIATLAVIAVAGLIRSGGLRAKGGAISRLLSYSYWVCALGAVVIIAAYEPSVATLDGLDEVFGGRLRLGNQALYEYGAPLLGQEIEFIGNGLTTDTLELEQTSAYNYVDCLYVRLLVECGPIFLAVFLVCETLVCINAREEGDVLLLVILCVTAVHCVIDDSSRCLWYNPFLLLIGQIRFVNKAGRRRVDLLSPSGSAVDRLGYNRRIMPMRQFDGLREHGFGLFSNVPARALRWLDVFLDGRFYEAALSSGFRCSQYVKATSGHALISEANLIRLRSCERGGI